MEEDRSVPEGTDCMGIWLNDKLLPVVDFSPPLLPGQFRNHSPVLVHLDAHPEPSRRGGGLVLSVRRPQERVFA